MMLLKNYSDGNMNAGLDQRERGEADKAINLLLSSRNKIKV